MLDMINMIVSIAIGVVYTPLVLRFLGQSEYGVYTIATSVLSYLAMLDLGFGNALIRYSSRFRAEGKDDKDINGLFLIFALVVSVISIVIGAILEKNLGSFFDTSLTGNETIILIRVYKILLYNTVLTFPLSVFSSVIRSHEKFIFINGLNFIQNIAKHIIMILFLYVGYRSEMLAVISLAFTAVLLIIEIYYVLFVIKAKFGFERLENGLYKDIFYFSFFILLNIIVDQLYANTDKVILGKICGSAAVSIYGIGVVFQNYFTQFSVSISSVFFSHMSKLAVEIDGIKQMSKTFNKVGRLQFMLLAYILIGFFVFGKEFIVLWAGEGYEEAYYIALVVMIPSIIPLSQNIGISILRALNKHNVRSIMYLCIAILNVILSIPLAVRWGGTGAAIGTAIGNLLGQILFMNWYYSKKIGLDIKSYWKQIAEISIKYIPVMGIFLLFDKLIYSESWFGLFLKILLAGGISAVYCVLAVISKEESVYMHKIVNKIKRN